ncbi:MAG: single-stranded-DNA-specific exonuclease RecJ [Candidatus Kerfeldbacteria bacterium]|nr:single-stranded-DNA-specific exonuclease RecJ [Candidatus Kerfeldbacteria bacterium]
MKRWRFHAEAPDEVVRALPDLPPLLVRILANRGLATPDEVQAFLRSSYDEHLHDPLLFRDMAKAITRIAAARERGEKIMLYGDYDVDGVSALSILFSSLRALDCKNIGVYIPDRYSEGYGLNESAVKKFIQGGIKLLITCDCGTSNVNEIALAQKAGIDVIVVDHHKAPPKLPEAYAFLNPAFADEPYPFKKLCSGGVAFKLATALLHHVEYGKAWLERPLPAGWEKWLLDLATLATVADMMPLIGENRVIVKHGLTVLRKTRRHGLRTLAEVMGTPLEKFSALTIGFQIAPRLNAAGRLKHANASFRLLTTADPAEARALAEELDRTNRDRQQLTDTIFREALDQVRSGELSTLVVAHGEGWSSGVIGLVAGKLKEVFHRPTLAIGVERGKVVGSGRSISGFDITQALVESSEYLLKFGGHPMACGFTVKSVDDVPGFVAKMTDVARRELGERDLTPELLLDADLTLGDVSWELVEQLARLEPFGMAVPQPVFASRNLRVLQFERVGRDGKHLRLRVLDDEGRGGRLIGFGFGDWADRLGPGDRYDLAYRVGTNEWNGNRELQLTLVDLRPTQ